MILLIGGTSSSGKTKLASTLMKRLAISYVSVDHIMMGIYRSNPNCGFTPMSDVATINMYIWPMIREMIKTNIENNHSLIFEGFQILPINVDDFEERYQASIVSTFLCLEPSYIDRKYSEILKHRSVVENRSDTDDPETMKKYNFDLIEECKRLSKNCYTIKEDYEGEMVQIVEDLHLTLFST